MTFDYLRDSHDVIRGIYKPSFLLIGQNMKTGYVDWYLSLVVLSGSLSVWFWLLYLLIQLRL